MTRDELTKRLAADREAGLGPSLRCPDEHLLAGFADGTIDAEAAVQLERHLADCGHCLELVAFLVRERDAVHGARPTPAADSRMPATARVREVGWGSVQKWAVAAALVLIVPILFQMGRSPDHGAEGQGSPPSAATRMLAPGSGALRVLSPAPGSAIDPSRLVFSWMPVTGTPFYEVRIVTDEGDVVLEQRVTATTWRPSVPLDLKRGQQYFVLVEAYPSGDKALSSRHVPFRIPE